MERIPDSKTQEKLAKVFKAVISTGLVAPVFFSVSACEKSKPVIEETETTKAPEATAPPETTSQETTPPTTEVMETGPIEYEGMIINPVEGLSFDNGTFYYLDGNPYGGKVGAEAGKAIPNGLEFNKEKIPTIAFSPEVINFWQHKFFEQEGKLFIPIPLDGRTEGVQIDTVENKSFVLLEKRGTSLIINAPIGTKIYSPLETELREDFDLWQTGTAFQPNKTFNKDGISEEYKAKFSLMPLFNLNEINYENFNVEPENIYFASVIMTMQHVSLLPPLADSELYYLDANFSTGGMEYIEEEEFDAAAQKEDHHVIPFRLISMDVGEPVVEIIASPVDRSGFSGPCSVEMFFLLYPSTKDEDFVLGDESLILEIGGSKVSILPANG